MEMNRPFGNASRLELNSSSRDTVSIGEIISSLAERWILILSSAAICGLAAFLYVSSIVDSYTASSEIMLYPQRERVLGSEEILPNLKPDEMLISTQIEVLESRSMAEMLVDTFDLQNEPSWNGELALRKGLNLMIAEWTGKNKRRDVPPEMKRINAVERVMESTSAEQVRGSLVLSIRATAFDPKLAANMSNALRDAYIGTEKSMSDEASTRARGWFKSRLDALETELHDKERAVAAFRETHGLIAASGSTLTEQQVLDSQVSVATARAELLEKEALLNQIIEASASTDRLAEIGIAVGSTQIGELRRRDSEVNAKLADYATKYGPKHPEYLSLAAESQSVKQQIQAELDRIIRAKREDVNLSRSRLALAVGDRGEYQQQLAQNNSSLVRLRELERDAAATKEVFENYAKRFQEVNDQASLTTTPVRLVATAVSPTRSDTPSMGLSLVAAVIIGAMLGVGAGLLLNAIDDRVRNKSDVNQRLGKPVFGLIPLQISNPVLAFAKRVREQNPIPGLNKASKPPWQWMIENKFSRFGESFRLLQKYIHFSQEPDGVRIVAITSAVPSEGKTTTAICLARSIALSGRKTLLVDCDTRMRGVTTAFSKQTKDCKGLVAAFASSAPVSEMASRDTDTPAHILGCIESDKHAEDIFSRPEMQTFLKRASLEYEVIILDSPPVLALSDAVSIAGHATQTLFVVRSNYVPSRLSRAGIDQIEEGGGHVAGVILNRVRADSLSLFSSSDRNFYKKIQQSYYSR